jgi:exopolyphosphatase / guanosine-5'-triphosphate,3'-diphosphate pyrophosphatase
VKRKAPKRRLIAVIDIGSNSVRLVVYRGYKRSPDILFNERVFCALGEGIEAARKMRPKAMQRALATLVRFSLLCRDMKVDEIEAVATSAVRDAKNGASFVRKAKKLTGFKVRVLSGQKEAELSAWGVLAGFPGARGVMGDLGGGSLELTALTAKGIAEKVSLPIGPIRLLDEGRPFTAADVANARKAIASVKWLAKYRGLPFYAVGGSWRAIAHLHLIQTGWPLHVLHAYRMPLASARRFTQVMAREGPKRLPGLDLIPGRRLPTLPFAAQILAEILEVIEPEAVITSAYGLREGIMFRKLPKKVRRDDPLVAACREFGERNARFADYGDLLMKWTAPLFPKEKPAEGRMRLATCHLGDAWWNAHPDFKAEVAYFRSLVGRFVGADHPERAQISTALFIAYGGPPKAAFLDKVKPVLSAEQFAWAAKVGLVVRLAQRLTGGTGHPLKASTLRFVRNKIILTVPEKRRELVAEPVVSRLKALARHTGATYEVNYV